MQEIFLGAAITGIIGFILALPEIVLEAGRRRSGLPFVSDINVIGHLHLNEREVFAVSLLTHLIIATLTGGLYVLFVHHGWLVLTHAPYSLWSILIFTVGWWLVVHALIFPLVGMGFFARKEGKYVWFEMLVMHLLLGLGFWLAVMYYRPFFF